MPSATRPGGAIATGSSSSTASTYAHPRYCAWRPATVTAAGTCDGTEGPPRVRRVPPGVHALRERRHLGPPRAGRPSRCPHCPSASPVERGRRAGTPGSSATPTMRTSASAARSRSMQASRSARRGRSPSRGADRSRARRRRPRGARCRSAPRASAGATSRSTRPVGRQEPVRRGPPRRPRLDRVARCANVVLRDPEPLAAGDPQLRTHEVDPGHRLGDGVLDLEPGVHLEEAPRPVGVEEELRRADPLVRRPRARSRAPPCPRRSLAGGSPHPERALPRRSSDAVAGASSRARRGARRSRGRRAAPAPRRDARRSSAVPGTPGRRRRPPRPRARAAASASGRSASVVDGAHPAAAAATPPPSRGAAAPSRSAARASAASAEVGGPRTPGRSARPPPRRARRAPTLSPRLRIVSRRRTDPPEPCRQHRLGELGPFSDRNPYPGCTASAPACDRRRDDRVRVEVRGHRARVVGERDVQGVLVAGSEQRPRRRYPPRDTRARSARRSRRGSRSGVVRWRP